MVWRDEDEWSRPRRRRGSALPLLVALTATLGAAYLVGWDPTGSSRPSVLDKVAAVAGSLAGGDRAFTYDDGLDGEQGSGGPGYSFTRLQRDGVSPVTWPCEGTIPVEVNPEGAPAGYESIVANAVARTNAASGFRFEVVGETSDRDFLSRGAGPVLLGFADATEVELLEGDIAGVGGSVYARTGGADPITAVGGLVVLDIDDVTDRLPAEHAEAVLIHELAHVLGLGHTDAPGQLMRAAGTGQTDFGVGDLAGLQHLREHACS
jgi:hypothetical protein